MALSVFGSACQKKSTTPEEPGLPATQKIANFGALPRWSPDGEKLLFGGEGANVGLWVYYHAGDSLQQLTDENDPHLWDYRWSPDGLKIAFGGAGSTADSNSGIFVVALDGSASVRWHNTGRSPSWLPDGSGLSFEEIDAGAGNYGIFKLNFADTTIAQLYSSGADPQYSPNGSLIAFREPGQTLNIPLKTIPAGGGAATSIADTCLHFCWTADGAALVYDYMYYSSSNPLRICRALISGGTKNLITQGGGEPSVSGSDKVVFQGVNVDLSLGIYIADLDGSDKRQITTSGYQPAITPDGSLIAFAREDGIWLVTP